MKHKKNKKYNTRKSLGLDHNSQYYCGRDRTFYWWHPIEKPTEKIVKLSSMVKTDLQREGGTYYIGLTSNAIYKKVNGDWRVKIFSLPDHETTTDSIIAYKNTLKISKVNE